LKVCDNSYRIDNLSRLDSSGRSCFVGDSIFQSLDNGMKRAPERL
jgi:hypothetical protein